MNPRYIVHIERFDDDTLYIKIEDGEYSIWRDKGKIKMPKFDHKKAINQAESFIRNGIWREVKVEELVLII